MYPDDHSKLSRRDQRKYPRSLTPSWIACRQAERYAWRYPIRCGSATLSPSNVSGKEHPAAFPVRLAEMCIQLHGRSRGRLTVLDPFMGSGSTALAARALDCDYVGFEIDPQYIEIAQAKLSRPVEKQASLIGGG